MLAVTVLVGIAFSVALELAFLVATAFNSVFAVAVIFAPGVVLYHAPKARHMMHNAITEANAIKRIRDFFMFASNLKDFVRVLTI